MGRPKGSKNKSKEEDDLVKTVAPSRATKTTRVATLPPKVEEDEDEDEDEDIEDGAIEDEELVDDGLSSSAPAYVPELVAPQVSVQTPTGNISGEQLVQIMGQLGIAVQTLADNQPTKKIPFAKFKTKSPFNPTGRKGRKLTRRVYQNYHRVDVKKLHDEEIALLNQIKPGRYLNGVLTIREVMNGADTDLHFLYDNKSQDQKFTVMREFRGHFTEMLKRCINDGPKPIVSRD